MNQIEMFNPISLPFHRPYRSTREVQQDNKVTDSEERAGSAPRCPDNRCHKALPAAKINIHRRRRHVTRPRVLSAACHRALLPRSTGVSPLCSSHCRTAEVTPRNTGSLCTMQLLQSTFWSVCLFSDVRDLANPTSPVCALNSQCTTHKDVL